MRLQTQGEQVLAAALQLAQEMWTERLAAAYALGSLAHGGFSAVSDIDVAFMLRDPLVASDADAVKSLADSIKASRKPFADRLSVFWGSPDRLDLIKYGRLIAGNDVRGSLAAPSRMELTIAGAQFALSRLGSRDVRGKLRNAAVLAASDPKTLTKLILYPVRFMFTAETGDVGRNDAAVEHYVGRVHGPQAQLVRRALDWRNNLPAPNDPGVVQSISDGVLPGKWRRELFSSAER